MYPIALRFHHPVNKINGMTRRKKSLVWLSSILAVLVVIALLAGYFSARIILHFLFAPQHAIDVYTSPALEAAHTRITTEDGLGLDAWELAPDTDPKGGVVILSGLQGPSVTHLHEFGEFLQDQGYTALLLEMRGIAGSEGDHEEGGLGEIRDLKAGLTYLRSEHPDLPLGVWGTSMGGFVTLASLDYLDADTMPAAVVATSSYTNFPSIFADTAIAYGLPESQRTAVEEGITEELGERYGEYTTASALHAVQNTDTKIMLAYAEGDVQVPSRHSKELIAAARAAGKDPEVFAVEGKEHFIVPANEEGLTEYVGDTSYGRAVADFFARNLRR